MARSLPILNSADPSPASSSPDFHIQGTDSGTVRGSQYAGNAAVITLGCAKNLVDSEVMLGVLRQSGYQIVTDLEQADVAVVNTCSFLESAVRESLDSILEAADYKKNGRLRKLVVAGCLVGRYGTDLNGTLPEVDAFISGDQLLDVDKALSGDFGSVLRSAARPYFLYDDTSPRIRSTERHTAYIKISEGCNRPCTFCIIPQIRGGLRSRQISSVVNEVQSLRAQGVREFNLVGQDLTAFGSDYTDDQKSIISDLLYALDEVAGKSWIRLLYTYPLGITADLLNAVKRCSSVCNYLDIPLQHASESVLRRMKRPVGKFLPERLVEFIKSEAPEVCLRTTFIVGFPGETEEDISRLEHLVRQGYFSSVGVFTYSQEEGTPAALLSGQVSDDVKEERKSRILAAQQAALHSQEATHIGAVYPVLVEGNHPDTDLLLIGRAPFQAPEVDGTVIINEVEDSQLPVTAGSFYDVRITEVKGYDLIGTIECRIG
jgi:ribosomal protein S12 methylthiotransferase